MLPQQKPQVQLELKAVCNALWGQTAACVYTILLKHLRQQVWGLSIHTGLIPDLYSQFAWVSLTATPHGKHREHPALTAPTKASHTHHLAEPPCWTPEAPSTCQHVPTRMPLIAHIPRQKSLSFIGRAQLGDMLCRPIVCVPPIHTGKQEVVLVNWPAKSWHRVKY